MSNLDPRWTALIYNNMGGEDFLGLRAIAARNVEYLMPGITTITPRARYYPFYSWLLFEYGQSHPSGMSLGAFIKRREQIFVLANLAWADSSDDISLGIGLQGSGALSKHWEAHRETDSIPLTKNNYLKASRGGFDAYSGVVQDLNLIRWQDTGTLDILPKGLKLAEAFEEAVRDTHYYEHRQDFDQAETISNEVLVEYGARCYLGGLASSPDRLPTLEALFAFETDQPRPHPGESGKSLANMKVTLGLILHMLEEAELPLGENAFRAAIALGPCEDYALYQPADPLRPFLAHWQMFQLREYYVYALYALWSYFLHWLRLEGPRTFEEFRAHLDEMIDLAELAEEVGFAIPSKSVDQWSLESWLSEILKAAGVPEGDWAERCRAFSQKSDLPFNEHALYLKLKRTNRSEASRHVGLSWLMLSVLYLRLSGLQENDRWDAWYWAQSGGVRRRSLHLFIKDISSFMTSGESVLDACCSLYRDYIIAQHTIIVLEKWRDRGSNTFHFNYEEGRFEWVKDDSTGFSASRFRQARQMLADLGLYALDSETRAPYLTDLGRTTLQRVLEACSE